MKIGVFDRLSRENLPFATAKKGDVGHDLLSVILISEMGFLERLIHSIFRSMPPFVIIWPNQIKPINSGLHLSMPSNVWCEVRARSSASKRKLGVIGGIIDSGYHGELYTVLHNMAWRPQIIKEGERYSQVIFHEALRPEITVMQENEFLPIVESSERAMAGFGSTGR